jgi:hypothetical protein
MVRWDIGAYEFNSFRPPQFIAAPKLTADGWKLTVTGDTNNWVRLQRSSNLRDWEDCGLCFMGANGVQPMNDPDTA